MTNHPLRATAAILCAALALAGCSSEKDPASGGQMVKAAASAVLSGRKAGEAKPITRAELNAYKTPMIEIKVPQTGLTAYVVPISNANGVETWASASDQSVSFRDGIMVATRGFGPDLMRSEGPSLARIAQGTGTVTRRMTWLDGSDAVQQFDFVCELSVAGSESITVVDRQHSTRHVLEHCTGEHGEFTNEYWLEGGNFLRKSKQLLVISWEPATLSRVID